MNLKIVSLTINCRNGNVFIPIDNHIYFVYGNSGVGKTTFLNLIMYALGGSLVQTDAVRKEVESVTLQISLDGKHFLFIRKINSNIIVKEENNESTILYAKPSYDLKKPKKTVSDFFYESQNLESHTMIRGNNAKDIRVTFSNYLWYSYLRQEELDNTFFYLGQDKGDMREFASNYVMRILLEDIEVSAKSARKEINLLKEKKERLKTKITVSNDISKSSPLLGIDIEKEIEHKRKEIIGLQDSIQDIRERIVSQDIDVGIIDDLLSKQKLVGMYLAEVRYLSEIGKIRHVISGYSIEEQEVLKEIRKYENYINSMDGTGFQKNLDSLAEIFRMCMKEIGFSFFYENDIINIDPRSFLPKVYASNGRFKFDYYNLSSGGQKSIFKICFALAIHIYVKREGLKTIVPNIMIIDTPMKNISEREDFLLCEKLYGFFKKLFETGGELSSEQLIIVDKEFPQVFANSNVAVKKFSAQNPLIPFLK